MKEQIQTTTQNSNEFDIGTQFVFNDEPDAPNIVLEALGKAVSHVKLEARMIAFDALHNTNYRAIRHDLVREEKRRRFEESIGIVAIGKK